MIDVSTELKTAFLSDSVRKEVEIEFENKSDEPTDFSRVNFFSKHTASKITSYPDSGYTYTSVGYVIEDLSNTDDYENYLLDADYISIDLDVTVLDWVSQPDDNLLAYIRYDAKSKNHTSTTIEYSSWVPVRDETYHVHDVIRIREFEDDHNDCLEKIINIKFNIYDVDDPNHVIGWRISWSNIQINLYRGTQEEAYTNLPYGIPNTIQTQFAGYNTANYVTVNNDITRVNFYPSNCKYRSYSASMEPYTTQSTRWTGGTAECSDILPYFNQYSKIALYSKLKIVNATINIPSPSFIEFGYAYIQGMGGTSYRTVFVGTDIEPYDSETFVGMEKELIHVLNVSDALQYDGVACGGFRFLKADRTPYVWSDEGVSTSRADIDVDYMQITLGNDESLLPYNFESTVQFAYFGYDVSEYVPVIPEEQLPTLTNNDLTLESLSLSESLSSSNVLKFGATESSICSFETTGLNNFDNIVGKYFRLFISCEGIDERLPLGRFRVSKVTKRGAQDIVIKHIEAYDGMYPLSMNGLNWYNNYMGVIPNFLAGDHNTYHVARQMFSSLYNITKNLNIDLDIKNIDYSTLTLNDVSSAWAGEIILKYRAGYDINPYDYVRCAVTTMNTPVVPSTGTKVYRVDIGYDYKPELDEYFEDIGFYHDQFAMYPSRGGVIIWQVLNDESYEFLSVNDGDWFTLNPNTAYYYVCIPAKYHIWIGDEDNLRLREMTMTYPETINIYTGDFDLFSSDNLPVPLVYYNWKTGEVGNPGDVTLRDIIRSLVEITGHFFRYGRNGKIEFTKCDLAGLYPSETLYPNDDLYPRDNNFTEYLARSKYRYFECDDKETNHFGKIQVVLQSVNENEPASKLYVGSESNESTYIIDDNVFYCASGVSYALDVDGTDPLPEVTTMLSNLYNQIKSVYYVPCEIEAMGMPWFECGDRMALFTKMGGFETFIFRRRLKGIHNLVDTYESLGEEQTESVIEEWR